MESSSEGLEEAGGGRVRGKQRSWWGGGWEKERRRMHAGSLAGSVNAAVNEWRTRGPTVWESCEGRRDVLSSAIQRPCCHPPHWQGHC